MPSISVMTPTILRSSLFQMCRSLDVQSNSNWEHIIVVDSPIDQLNMKQFSQLNNIPSHVRRTIKFCGTQHKDYGHTCSRLAVENARGDYVWVVDDDDFLAHNNVINDLQNIAGDWVTITVNRLGRVEHPDPPKTCHTTHCGFLVKNGLEKMQENCSYYGADGDYVELLKTKYAYSVFRTANPMVVIPQIGRGVYTG